MNGLKDYLPKEPMAPIVTETIPSGSEWGYQLKWDGVRILSLLNGGEVSLVSRKLLNKTALYPEVVSSLSELKEQRLILDGEVVYFHPELGRPVFQKVLQRERSRAISTSAPLFTYVLFDILLDGDRDMRQLPYIERHQRLQQIVANKPGLLVADLFNDGESLWKWAEDRGWEGIVIKRLSSPYREGKKHQDWYKKKIAIRLKTEAIAMIIREGRVASLVLAGDDGSYIGRASLGLNEQTKRQLLHYAGLHSGSACWKELHTDLKKEKLAWLSKPLTVEVTFLEWSQDGMMRHPKLLGIQGLG
ncbi:bifunctional non-homologous end joining protein LigD [Paenibacillus uliginis N3/975]|uniref:DNA ligase (ATP) n=1 Tax=Paenibacillus uliginis N3/975 TaxID=1313296 RepID=A0A1X7GQU6_9BACL|nr:RNA ligase family protein [Paenibacillus uliginis]SMF72869.1 bifunctional non-homologous end joining protein LigD [Paenibacillus uliginis N3/975]